MDLRPKCAMASSGENTREYRAIQRHYSSLVDNLGKTVDPARFARKLREESLISESTIEVASLTTVTGSQRVGPAINAVLSQIKLKADIFHTFMSILKTENSCLADTISDYYTCSLELHALGVLESISEWKELGQQLNINDEKLLQLSQCGRDPEYCREQVVSEWLRGDKRASWEKLCRALERMGSEAEVLKIREQYISHDVPAVISSKGDTHSHRTEVSVVEEVNEFEGWFADLTLRLQTEMREKETPVTKFQQSITLLPIAIRKEHLKFVKESLKDIKQAEDIEELFMYLNLYWTFFDCALLEHLVTRHGSQELKEEMKTYAEELEDFRKKTTVEQLLKVCPDGFRSEEPPPNFSQIVLKLDRKASDYTLEELEIFRRRFCSKFSLPTFAVMLASCKEGSITIIWHIPSSEVHRFHNTAIQWNSISIELLQFQVDGLLLEFATKLNDQALKEYAFLTHLYLGSQGIDANGIALLLSSLRDKSCLQYIDLSCNKFGTEGAKYLAQALTENTALTHLSVRDCNIGEDGMASLSSSLTNKLCLLLLSLTGNKFSSKGVENLAQALEENTVLTHLYLRGCDIGDDGLVLLSSSLKNKLHLQALELNENKFGSRGAEHLALALAENTVLTKFYLSWCDISDDGLAVLSSSLKNKLHLQVLELSENKFGSRGAEYLAQALAENTILTHLYLSGCGIGYDGLALLSSSLRNKSHLQVLGLSDNKFGSRGAEYLARALAENTVLTRLYLRRCDIDGVSFLSYSLKNKSCLQHLFMDQNKFGPKGAEYLAQALTENTALTHLSLEGCDIGANGLTLLSSSLKNKSHLQYLDLDYNTFGSKEAEYLAQALAENTVLTHLYLSRCDIDDDGITLLSSSLKNKPCLQVLTLCENKFGSHGAEYLAQALSENTSLAHLDLSGCDIGPVGVATLSSSLKNKSCFKYFTDLRDSAGAGYLGGFRSSRSSDFGGTSSRAWSTEYVQRQIQLSSLSATQAHSSLFFEQKVQLPSSSDTHDLDLEAS